MIRKVRRNGVYNRRLFFSIYRSFAWGEANEVSGEPLGTGGIGQANSRAITEFFLFSLLKRYGLPGAKSR